MLLKRIGFDISALDPNFKEHATRGIGRYVSGLKGYFDGLSKDGFKIDYFRESDFNPPQPIKFIANLLPFGRITFRQQFTYPLRLRSQAQSNFDLIHFPAHMDAPAWGLKRYAITVLDLIPLVLSDLYMRGRNVMKYKCARFLEVNAIKNADLVLAISENTARDVNKILGIPWEKIVVTPLGVDARFFQDRNAQNHAQFRAEMGLPASAKLVTYVGGIDQRKNMYGLLKSFELLISRYRERGAVSLPHLVIAGKIQEDKEYPALLELIQRFKLKDLVLTPGFISEQKLLELYAASSCFFFPSLYEGFGLPPLEAMASGLPVVSSDASCMPEVLGAAALYFSPTQYEQAAEKIFSVLENSDLSEEMKFLGVKRAQQFTWNRTGELTLSAYQKLAA